ncbi:GNAT family N-acetyltransferase [Streptococcus sp.]
MKLVRRTRLSIEEKTLCEQLVRACHQIDQTYRLPYLDNLYNADPNMPAFVLAFVEDQLVGFLSIYADEPKEAEVQLFVTPSFRRRGIARSLWKDFMDLAQDYQLEDRLYVSEFQFLDQHPELLSHFHLVEAKEEEHELWLEAPCQVTDHDKREGLMVLEAEESMLQEIAHFQSKAFETDLDYALKYATESLEGQDTRLFVLRDQEQVLASVTVDVSQGTTYFFGLAVDPDHLRKGYARYLLRSVMNQMATEVEQQFQIVVEKENQAALSLYLGLGFTIQTEVLYLMESR